MQRKHNNKLDYKSTVYYKNFKKVTGVNNITQPVYTKVIQVFFSIVVRKLVNEMYKFHFPGLGYFYLTKNKSTLKVDEQGNIESTNAINWKETLAVRKITGDNTRKVFYLNEHTNDYVYGIYWDKKNVAFINRTFYSFIPCRAVQRYITKIIFSSIKPLNAYIR
jgi:hypothetical protein